MVTVKREIMRETEVYIKGYRVASYDKEKQVLIKFGTIKDKTVAENLATEAKGAVAPHWGVRFISQ